MATKRTAGSASERAAATPAKDVPQNLDQDLLRALLVGNESLRRVNDMLEVMTKILTRLLEQPTVTIFPPAQPPDTIEAKKANGPTDDVPFKPAEPSPIEEPKGPTLADLKTALQACIAAHDQDVARRCIAPYATYSMVPVDKLAEVIAKVEAATRSVVP